MVNSLIDIFNKGIITFVPTKAHIVKVCGTKYTQEWADKSSKRKEKVCFPLASVRSRV
jgi:hypothetical protein